MDLIVLRRLAAAIAVAWIVGAASLAHAASVWTTPDGGQVSGKMGLCPDGNTPPNAVPCGVPGTQPAPTKQGALTPLGFCQLSVTSAVQTSTCAGGIPSGATWALICNEAAAARWRDDGTSPTATVGEPVGAGSAASPVCFNYFGNFAALQWTAQSGTTLLDISFYK